MLADPESCTLHGATLVLILSALNAARVLEPAVTTTMIKEIETTMPSQLRAVVHGLTETLGSLAVSMGS